MPKRFIIIIFCFLSPAIFISGCIQPTKNPADFANKQELLEYLMKGYDKKHSFLYYERFPWDGSRLLTLIDGLGYEQFHFGIWDTSDGSALCLSETPVLPDRSTQKKQLILSTESPPRIVTSPKGAILDTHGNIIASRIKTMEGSRAIEFPNGYLLPANKMILIDEDYRYFCTSLHDTEISNSNTVKNEFLIYSFKNPEKPLIAAQFENRPRWMFSTGSELYLIHKDYHGKGKPSGLKLYIYKCSPENDALVFDRCYQIQCPWALFAESLYASAFDGINKQMIVSVVKSWPYPCERYLYNIITGEMTKLKLRTDDRIVLFFDPKILTNTVNYVSFEQNIEQSR